MIRKLLVRSKTTSVGRAVWQSRHQLFIMIGPQGNSQEDSGRRRWPVLSGVRAGSPLPAMEDVENIDWV